MSSIIHYGRALYYPYINFSNQRWLKTAALFYDSIDRIVPPGYDTFTDLAVTKPLNAEVPFINDVHPSQDVLSKGLNFVKFFDRELADEEKKQHYIEKIGLSVQNEEALTIYDAKISAVVKNKLIAHSLLPANNGSGTVTLDRVTAATYMTFLAGEMAKEAAIPVVTDDPVFQPVLNNVHLFSDETEEPEAAKDLGFALGQLVIKCAVPQGIEHVHAKKIAKFRKDHGDEQRRFYTAINGLVTDLEKINNDNTLEDILDYRKKEINDAVASLNDAIRSIRLTTRNAFLGISVPAASAYFGGPVAAVAGLAAVVTGKMITMNADIKKTKSANPYAYVLSLQNRLKSETFLDSLSHGKILF